jgi:hypothetical protein
LTRQVGSGVLDGLTLYQQRDEVIDPGVGVVGCMALNGLPDHFWFELAFEASNQSVG